MKNPNVPSRGVDGQTDMGHILALLEQVAVEANRTSSMCESSLKPVQRHSADNPFAEPCPPMETGAPLFLEIEAQLRTIRDHLTLIRNNLEVLEI